MEKTYVRWEWLLEDLLSPIILQKKILNSCTNKKLTRKILHNAHELAEKIRNKQVKSEDVIRAYIDRIREVNPILNAVVDERFELALNEAREVDKLINSGIKTKEQIAKETPLLGIPITFKEHINVNGMHCTSGLVSRKDFITDFDAPIVRIIKDAGAIVLGVTNVPELCFEWANCVNCVYGRTVNPYDTRRCAGASSGGEASILASGGSLVGVGTDMAGSILYPSMFCGVFGHKPTWGICLNEGFVPAIQRHLNRCLTPGPMCRYAADLKLMMKTMATKNIECLRLDEQVSLQKLKFYYLTDTPKGVTGYPIRAADREILDAHEKVIKYLEEKHNIIVEKISFESDKLKPAIQMAYSIISDPKVGMDMENSLEVLGENINAFKETFKVMLHRSQYTSFLVGMILVEKYVKAREPAGYREKEEVRRERFVQKLETVLGDNGVILYPTLPKTAFYHYNSFMEIFDVAYVISFTLWGFPSTHCPLGLSSEGLPLGIQVISNRYNDRFCLAVAEEIERGFGGWVKPS